jgi:hypothetical protein
MFVYYKGKTKSVGKDLVSVAVSNAGKYIYSYNDENGSLYVSEIGKEKSKLSSGVIEGYVLNKDNTQIIFNTLDSSYFSLKGKTIQKIGSSGMFPSEYNDITLNNSCYIFNSDTNTLTCPKAGLLDNYFINGNNDLMYVDNNYKSNTIEKDMDDSVIFKNTLFYVKASTLYKESLKKPGNSVKIADDVTDMKISSDGKYVYYVNTDDELFCKKGNADSVKVSDNVNDIELTGKNVLLYEMNYDSGSNTYTLYSCSDGKNSKKISDGVYDVVATSTAAYYTKNYNSSGSTYDLYASSGKGSFSLVVSSVRMSMNY